jgi:capsular polysaccharide transport system permease protein
MAVSRPLRSPLTVTITVWKALFLRETLSRIAQDRISWVGLMLEPVAHISLLMFLFSVGLRQTSVVGADTGIFLMLGITTFFMVRNVLTRCLDVVDSSESLYAFRQIRPVDTVITRALSEGLLMCVVFLIIFTGAALFGLPVIPADPLTALQAWGVLWLLGLGLGLTFSVVSSLVPEVGRVVRLLIMPFYFFSAVMFPSTILPVSIREILLLNPVLHGIELLRVAYMPTYQVPPGLSLTYVAACALPLILLGLALHVRYRNHLMTQ